MFRLSDHGTIIFGGGWGGLILCARRCLLSSLLVLVLVWRVARGRSQDIAPDRL